MLTKPLIQKFNRLAKKEVSREKNEPPPIETVDEKTAYLLDEEGRRLRRICGHIDSEGWPCTMPAGKKTYHEGEGRCWRHSFHLAGHSEYSVRLANELSKESKLKKDILDAEQIEDVFNLEDATKLIYAFIKNHIEKRQFDWRVSDSLTVSKLIDQIRRLSEAQVKKDQAKLNASVITMLLQEFRKVISSNVSREIAQKIYADMKNIDIPVEIEDVEFAEEP